MRKENVMKWFSGFLIGIMILFGINAYAQNEGSLLGQWYTEEDLSVVEIFRCGDQFCGKIVWLKHPQDEMGKDKVDTKNPDESLRKRPLLGLQILNDFKYKGANEWGGGTIYDPRNGKTYSCKITHEGNTLKVRGFVGISLLGRTAVWKKKT